MKRLMFVGFLLAQPAWAQVQKPTEASQVAILKQEADAVIKPDIADSLFLGEIWACQVRPFDWVKSHVDETRLDAESKTLAAWGSIKPFLSDAGNDAMIAVTSEINQAYQVGLLGSPTECGMASEEAGIMDSVGGAP